MTRMSKGRDRPVQPENPHALTLRLDRTLAARLNLAAIATDEAISEIIRAALRAHLDELEASPANRARYAELRAALNPTTEGP